MVCYYLVTFRVVSRPSYFFMQVGGVLLLGGSVFDDPAGNFAYRANRPGPSPLPRNSFTYVHMLKKKRPQSAVTKIAWIFDNLPPPGRVFW